MTTTEFLIRHNASAHQISAPDCLEALLGELKLGLQGKGNLPMLPSFLSTNICIPEGARCGVLDAGGTNLRTALAAFQPDGTWKLEQLARQPMPGTVGELSYRALYQALAEPLRQLGPIEKVGFCFSYNVTMNRTLDGTLDFWCKEIQAPEAVGQPVGASLQEALGPQCRSVHVLNDSVAAMLGAGTLAQPVQIGVILGTGINVCYQEQCSRITKLTAPLPGSMIISTEIGEFDQIPKSDFEQAVIARSDAPQSAHAEKQCAGGYLSSVICQALQTAAAEGLLPRTFTTQDITLGHISSALSGTDTIHYPDTVLEIAREMIHRAAKIAAILCAGPMVLCHQPGQTLRIAMEGSQYWKLTGFREKFHLELDALTAPYGIRYEILQTENACLTGAALAAFALPL